MFICGNNHPLSDITVCSGQKNCWVKESCGIDKGLSFSFIKWCILYTCQYIWIHISIYIIVNVVHSLCYIFMIVLYCILLCVLLVLWPWAVRTKTFAHFWSSLVCACSEMQCGFCWLLGCSCHLQETFCTHSVSVRKLLGMGFWTHRLDGFYDFSYLCVCVCVQESLS